LLNKVFIFIICRLLQICLCCTTVMLTDIIMHSITVVVDAFVRIALWEFFPQNVTNGDDDGRSGFLLVERMVHRG